MSDFQRLKTWLVRAAPRRADLLRALVAASVASLAGVALFIGALALLVVSSQRPGLRAVAVFLILIELVAFLRSPLRFGERMSTHRLGFAAVSHWRQWLMSTVGRWSFSRWQSYGAGDLLERSLTDTEELQDLWLRGVIPSVATLVTMYASDCVVALLAPGGGWLAVAVLLATVQSAVIIGLAARLGPQILVDRQLRRRRGAYRAALISSRDAAPEIERLGASEFLRRRDEKRVSELRRAEDEVSRERGRGALFVVAGPLLALAVVNVAHPTSAPVWTVVAAVVAVTTFEAMVTLRGALHVAVGVTGGAERLDELEVPPLEASKPWPDDTTLSFREVAVARTPLGARRVSGVVAPGRRVGVKGPSGSGKSTLLRALARLDDVDAEAIKVGAEPTANICESDWRAHVTLVPSEPGLLRGYVRDVVGLGAPIEEADIAALAALGVEVSPNGYFDNLSRGEGQRVALVRALARRSDILLLDEPTSALGDVETDAVLALLSTTTTSLVVASHDPRILDWCDEVIEL